MILYELFVRSSFKIRKGSIVTLKLKGQNPAKVQITKIFVENDNILIESVDCDTKTVRTHNSKVYRKCGSLVKF